ncbi:MAG: hypothetical protein P4M13_00995 [Alphaproteobacteria bacterium]|nr:hypothetical protein [Alphaproteobacteria bacterium]
MHWVFRSGICAVGVVFCASVLFHSPASANSLSGSESGVQTIHDSNSSIWVSAGESTLGYKEAVSPIPDSQHGSLPSVAAGLNYMTGGNWYFAFEGARSFGDDTYTGAILYSDGSETPTQFTSHETITTVDGKIGRGYVLGRSVMLTPYAEIGYRYWDRNLGGGQVEDYSNFDFLAGLMGQWSPFRRLILSAYASAGTTFAGKMETDHTTCDLDSAGMYKVGGKIGFDLTRRWEIFTALDYDHFHYVASPWVADYALGAYIMEPSSRTSDTALRAGLSYHFM